MSATPSSLEIHIYTYDGEVKRFMQNDPGEIRQLLDQMQPDKIFTQRQILIAGSYSLTAFLASAVTRIDLVMDASPDWPFHHGVTDAVQITREEFQERYRPEVSGTKRTEQVAAPGQPITAFLEIDLVDTESVFLQVQTQAQQRTPLDVGPFIQRLFVAPGLYTRRRGGGAILVNPVNIARLTFFPGPPQTPPGALSAHYLAD